METRVFPASDAALYDALAFAEEELEKMDCSMKDMAKITVCVEEMFVNIAHYAYEGKEGNVEMTFDCEGRKMSVTLADEGVAFDPLAKEDPDITLSAEERRIGGLGIYMVKKSMDEVRYSRKGNKNYFTMIKEI